MFIGALLGGRFADSLGRKRVLVASITVFGLFSLLTGFTSDVQFLALARALTGLGFGRCVADAVGAGNEE